MNQITKQCKNGFTLVELLVSMVVSLFLILTASAFFINSMRSREMQDAATQLQDTARFISSILTKNIQQAGFQNYILSSEDGQNMGSNLRRENNLFDSSNDTTDILGFNNSGIGGGLNHGKHNRSSNRVNHNDTLLIRYQGMGDLGQSDGSIINCLGQTEAAPQSGESVIDRPYSVFAVGNGSTTGGEPELLCKYYSKSPKGNVFVTQPIARGVEYFQVIYGVDLNNDQNLDRFMNAYEVDLISAWQHVKVVRIGIILRSAQAVNDLKLPGTTILQPLGSEFSSPNDPGSSFEVPNDNRLRKVLTLTINLRNDLRWDFKDRQI